jgi:hypothetical protein
VQGRDVEHAARGTRGDRVADGTRERCAIERGRHDEQAQVRPQVTPALERERQAEVALQVALVELVEDHARDSFERGIVLQHAGQDALGDDLEAGRGACTGLEPGAEADSLAGTLAERVRHALRDCARGDPARLEHHDPSVSPPGGIEQRERNDRALPGPRGRFQHDGASGRECSAQFRQRFEDGQ